VGKQRKVTRHVAKRKAAKHNAAKHNSAKHNSAKDNLSYIAVPAPRAHPIRPLSAECFLKCPSCNSNQCSLLSTHHTPRKVYLSE
jgi:hypothetical protein